MSAPHNEKTDAHITENSKINLAVVAFLFITLCGGAWWCSAINTKLDIVVEMVKPIVSLEIKLSDHEARLKNLEKK